MFGLCTGVKCLNEFVTDGGAGIAGAFVHRERGCVLCALRGSGRDPSGTSFPVLWPLDALNT
jgi:hypothetical protein